MFSYLPHQTSEVTPLSGSPCSYVAMRRASRPQASCDKTAERLAKMCRRWIGRSEDDDKEWRHSRPFSSNALGDRVPPRTTPLTKPLVSYAGAAPAPLRNSDRSRSSARHSSRKRCTRSCRCMLLRRATGPPGIFHRLISFQGPWTVSCKEISATSGFARPFARECARPTRSSCTRRRC
jgi:hypothetical protein